MFDALSNRLELVFKKLRGAGRLSEKNIKDAMREVRQALLEADVNYKVARDFVKAVEAKAVGSDVLKSIEPGQQQGSGKTTLTGKLALMNKRKSKKPLMVAADIYRPAAVKQLKVLADSIDVEHFHIEGKSPQKICQEAVKYAEKNFIDLVILDTAGRLHVDDELMKELEEIKDLVKPDELLLVADAMTGQDAVNIAKEFHDRLDITGVVLSKLDGDARGGAALSIRQVTGCPIKLASVGEKLSELEPFHPDRLASRILGMGDIVSLVEKAQDTIDMEAAEKMQEKILKAQFDFEDFLEQIQQIRKMGPLENLMGMIPGVGKAMKGISIDEKDVNRMMAIVQSMTTEERRNPRLIDGSRKKRIAVGSGNSVQTVNQLLKQFATMQKMFNNMNKMKFKGMPKGLMPF
jgi:signal recognition particle subunit SRP54